MRSCSEIGYSDSVGSNHDDLSRGSERGASSAREHPSLAGSSARPWATRNSATMSARRRAWPCTGGWGPIVSDKAISQQLFPSQEDSPLHSIDLA